MYNKISTIFKEQTSDYLLEEYPDFVLFLKAYYDWLEESGNSLNFIQNYKTNIDIDLANSEFTNGFLSEMVGFLPNNEYIDEKTLIKYIKDFYIAKGSHESFRFIFNILFNSELSIIYPRDYIFKTSDSTWDGNIIVKTTNNNFYKTRIPKDANIKIVGIASNSTAIVDTSKIKSTLNGVSYVEFELSSYDKKFILNEDVVIYVNDVAIFESIYSQVSHFEILESSPGGFLINDIVDIRITTPNATLYDFNAKVSSVTTSGLTNYTIIDGGLNCVVGQRLKVSSEVGYGFSALVSKVDNTTGEILEIEIVTPGYFYDGQQSIVFEEASGIVPDNPTYGNIVVYNPNIGKIKKVEILNSGFTKFSQSITYDVYINDILVTDINPIFDSIFHSKMEYKNEHGFTSHNEHLQDSFYYQDFSYVLKNEINVKRWHKLIKELLHTAGSELFSQWVNINSFSLNIQEMTTTIEKIIQFIVEHLDGAGINIDIFSSLTLKRNTELKKSSIIGLLGNNYYNLDQLKFMGFFNWNIEEFLDLSIDDIEKSTEVQMEFGYSSITLI